MLLPASPEAREKAARLSQNEELRIKLQMLENEKWLEAHGVPPTKEHSNDFWNYIEFGISFILSCVIAGGIIALAGWCVYYLLT
ncbi:MAG: hypothetical protein IJQ58_00810 [Synergistaceae bacterium]|nr:hypothetical protein [Synergistaceae bacterium]